MRVFEYDVVSWDYGRVSWQAVGSVLGDLLSGKNDGVLVSGRGVRAEIGKAKKQERRTSMTFEIHRMPNKIKVLAPGRHDKCCWEHNAEYRERRGHASSLELRFVSEASSSSRANLVSSILAALRLMKINGW